jgi:nucleoid DNA-binding protein
MRYLNKESINERIARRYGLDEKQVAHATDFQFLYLAERIRSGHHDKGVRLPDFGRFVPNAKYIKYLKSHIMELAELQYLRAKTMKRSLGNIDIEKDYLLRVIDTAIVLYDKLGNENVYPGKTELGPKSQRTSNGS